MSALLHPVGPEPEETYWKRRAAVLAILVVVLILLAWGISSLFNRSDDTSGTPVQVSTSPESTLSDPPTTPGTTPESTDPESTGTESTETESTPTGTESGSPGATPEATPSSTASTSATESTAPASSPATTSASPSPSSSPSPTGPVLCTASDVVVEVSGAQRVNTGRTINLNIALTSKSPCVLDFTETPFELRIYSGSDRIWSTNDCSSYRFGGQASLTPGGTWTHTIPWNTRRSLGDCQLDSRFLLPGTYVATALVSGGEPSQHVMTVLA
ncbi:hypothetical protein ACPCG0_03610 [Propionibacteriaceae bacterium Y1923]|uniref:hypothetical protein n=1 Tax=Aestuariimicrobium sp. Y1814 TaxID=3418742 RepID=UPI003C193851